MSRCLAAFASVVLLAGFVPAQDGLAGPEVERRVDALLRQMTLPEKIGQLVQYSGGTATGPGAQHGGYPQQIAKGEIGSFLNVIGASATNSLQRIAVEQSRLKIPLLFGSDVIHGYRTIFPVPLGLASTWDLPLIEQAARAAAQEATADGIRWTFSPMVDIARDARWGRITEGAGEDPYLGAAVAAAYVRGYQGTSLANPDSLAACAKHFVGYGAAEGGREYNAAEISERTLRQIYLPPFQAAIRAGAPTIMSAFNTLDEVPASADSQTLTRILRRQWGFQGLVVSDWEAVKELMAHGVANDPASAARKALLAGVDMDMQSGLYQSWLAQLVQSGAVPGTDLDEAVRRVLRVKFSLGLFDHPYAPQAPAPAQLDPRHVELARRAAEQSFVLLKNEPVGPMPLLPLSSGARTLALVGPLADNPGEMLGSWPGQGNPRDAVTLKSALAQRLQQIGGRLLYAKGTEINTDNESGFAEALAAAKQSDVVIAALGEDAPGMTGEAASRVDLGLPGNQERLLERLVATGKPVVLVIFSGRPLALKWAAAHVPAMVEAWFPGVQAGPALVRTLFGDVNFSGKLTASMPRSVGQEPLYYDELNTGRPAGQADLSHPPADAEEKYLSRYIDELNTPLFPFGYGLSYTAFQYSPVTLSSENASAGELNRGAGAIRASATITNVGHRAGREIAQLYVRETGTSVARPVRELKGFQVLRLNPGESQKVEFSLGRDQLAFWNIDMRDVVEPAKVTVWIGPNSQSGSAAQFVIAP